jgi:hypothetical protein
VALHFEKLTTMNTIKELTIGMLAATIAIVLYLIYGDIEIGEQ